MKNIRFKTKTLTEGKLKTFDRLKSHINAPSAYYSKMARTFQSNTNGLKQRNEKHFSAILLFVFQQKDFGTQKARKFVKVCECLLLCQKSVAKDDIARDHHVI